MDIEKNNKLIAGFMGLYLVGCREGWHKFHLNTAMCNLNPEGWVHEEMAYHKSWNWLMPVVIELQKLKRKIATSDVVSLECNVAYTFIENIIYNMKSQISIDQVYADVAETIQYITEKNIKKILQN